MQKSKKLFLIVGLPLFCFMIFIMAIYYVIHLVWFLTIGITFLLCTYRKNRKFIALTKLSLVLFLYFVFICVNPIYWPQQISRHLNRGSLITPDAQCIADLNTTFVTSAFYNGPYNRSTLQGQMDELSDIQYFLYNPGKNDNDWINYTYDFFQYPGVFDHIPTAEEVLANRQDDCDGIAIVTVSLLVRLGYEAYIAESDSHWWTYVKIYGEDLNSSIRGQTYTLVYLNWWPSIGEPYVIFNQTTVIVMQPLLSAWWDQMTDGYYVEIIQEYGRPIFWMLPIIALVLGFIVSLAISFPRKYSKRRMHLINAALAINVIAIVLAIILLLPPNLWQCGNLTMILSFGILIFVIERDYLTKWFWKLEK